MTNSPGKIEFVVLHLRFMGPAEDNDAENVQQRDAARLYYLITIAAIPATAYLLPCMTIDDPSETSHDPFHQPSHSSRFFSLPLLGSFVDLA